MEHLIAFFKANRGKQRELASILGLYPSTVSQWKAVPAEHARKVADFTGIPVEQLRPDLAAMFTREAAQ
jgi:DNA-binding transcriptional regulator YdaS (Cro superfamily)